jgi:hypothetical protein
MSTLPPPWTRQAWAVRCGGSAVGRSGDRAHLAFDLIGPADEPLQLCSLTW